MRAFYRYSAPVDGVINDASINTGQPVPPEELQRLGVQLSQVGIGLQALEQAKSEAQRSGYPNVDGIKFDAESLSEDQFKAFQKLVETVTTQNTVLIHQLQFLWHSYSEDIFFDIQDPIRNKWIRVELRDGVLLDLPAGLTFRLGLNLQVLRTGSMTLFMKDPGAGLDHFITGKHIALGKDADEHRVAYLKALES
ncbi:1,2-dihydroxy-3-keto-5-methylthiopentene dioxygenase [Marasmius sp. AFHP31]|nr:1,2-dihydroxy-3-keto-5-methylthiopentene dioxygenase [Marasmius sp. AFHP31]